MGIKIIGTKAKVHWLTKNKTDVLTDNEAVLYVPNNPKKLGQVTRDSAAGLTPAEAFEKRYTDKSLADQNVIADDIFVVEKTYGEDYDYDDMVRVLVNQLYKKSAIEFDALHPGYQIQNTNSEALLGYDRTKHLSALKDVIKQAFNISKTYNTKKPFMPRFGQTWAIDQIVKGLTEYDKILFAGHTGIGKSKISLEAIHQYFNKGAFVLITTPIAETISSFKEAVADTRFGNNFDRETEIYSKRDLPSVEKIQASVNRGNLVVFIATVQDARYQDKITFNAESAELFTGLEANAEYGIREDYEELFKLVDLWVRDEYHKEYGGVITQKVFSNINTKKRLDLTATPYGVIDEYEPGQVIARTLLWALNNQEHTKVPQIQIDCLAGLLPKHMGTYKDMFSVEEGFHSHKLVEQNLKTGEFVNFGIIEDLVYKCYCDIMPRKKNLFSIINDSDLSQIAKQKGLWIFPEGANGISAREYITALTTKLNSSNRLNQRILFASAYEIDQNRGSKTVEEYIESISDERVLVILTHGKFKTGTDIPLLGHIVLLDKINSIAEFEQTAGRVERVVTDKDFTKIYAYSPAVVIKEVVATLANANTKLITEDEPKDEKDFLACFPITEYNGLSVVPVNPAEIFEQFQAKLRAKNSISNFKLPNDIKDMIEGDFELLKQLTALSTLSSGKKHQQIKTITEENNAEVFNNHLFEIEAATTNKLVKKDSTESMYNELFEPDSIVNGLEEIWKLVPAFAMTTKSTDVADAIGCKPIRQIVGDQAVDAIVNVIKTNAEFKQKLQIKLTEFLTAFRGLTPRDCYDIVFKQSETLKENGYIFTPFDGADFLVKKVIGNLKYILVPNALHGTIPLSLKEQYPCAIIVCAERVPYYIDHLKSLGFIVVMHNELNNWMKENKVKKFDLEVGNPPYNAEPGEDRGAAGNSNNSNLYVDFLISGATRAKKRIFLTPAGWSIKEKVTSEFKNVGLQTVEFLSSDMFPTVAIRSGLTITEFENGYDSDITVISDKGETRKQSRVVKFIKNSNTLADTILEKIKIYNADGKGISKKLSTGSVKLPIGTKTNHERAVLLSNGELNLTPTPDHPYKTLAFVKSGGNTIKYVYGKKKCPSHDYIKVVMSGATNKHIIGKIEIIPAGISISGACKYYICNNITEAEEFKTYLESTLVKFIVKVNKFNDCVSTSTNTWNHIPDIDTAVATQFISTLSVEELEHIGAT